MPKPQCEQFKMGDANPALARSSANQIMETKKSDGGAAAAHFLISSSQLRNAERSGGVKSS